MPHNDFARRKYLRNPAIQNVQFLKRGAAKAVDKHDIITSFASQAMARATAKR
jgi:hypothetical protein